MGEELGPSEPAPSYPKFPASFVRERNWVPVNLLVGCSCSLVGLLSELCRGCTGTGLGTVQRGCSIPGWSPLPIPGMLGDVGLVDLMLCGLFLAAAFYGVLPHAAKPPQPGWDGSTTVMQGYFPLTPVWCSRRQESRLQKAFPQLGRRISRKATGPKSPPPAPLAQLIPSTCPEEYI